MQVLRNMGSAFRLCTDETVLRTPKFARHLNPELAGDNDEYSPGLNDMTQTPRDDEQHTEQPRPSGIGDREQMDSPGTSYALPHLKADIHQQRYPVSDLHALVRSNVLPSCTHTSASELPCAL